MLGYFSRAPVNVNELDDASSRQEPRGFHDGNGRRRDGRKSKQAFLNLCNMIRGYGDQTAKEATVTKVEVNGDMYIVPDAAVTVGVRLYYVNVQQVKQLCASLIRAENQFYRLLSERRFHLAIRRKRNRVQVPVPCISQLILRRFLFLFFNTR